MNQKAVPAGRQGFSQIILLSTIATFILVGAGGFLTFREKKASSSEKTALQEASSPALGNLCSGKKGCISFCLNNRGQCENYCKGKGNELCKNIFPPKKQSASNVGKKQNCVSNPNPIFTKSFTDNSKIREISPIGNVDINNPGSRARSYVTVNPGTREGGMRVLVPIYVPVDSTITALTYANRNYNELGMRPEYRFDFQISCEVSYIFDHISNVVDDIKKLAPNIPAGDTRTGAHVFIPVKAGQLIGYTDGTYTAGGFDFMVLNNAHKEKYINPSRWEYDHSKYGVCPYDYFVPELKEKYYSLLQKTRRSDEKASCRSVSRDVAGTLAGGWFQGDSTDKKGVRLAIATVGNGMVDLRIMRGDQATLLRDYTNPYVMKPEDVTVGKSVCYYDRDRNIYAYLKLFSDLEMGLVMGSGQCLSSFPTEYETWVR